MFTFVFANLKPTSAKAIVWLAAIDSIVNQSNKPANFSFAHLVKNNFHVEAGSDGSAMIRLTIPNEILKTG